MILPDDRVRARLSEYELKVYERWRQGVPAPVIRRQLGRSFKSIDCALQRIRRKIVDLQEGFIV